MRAGKQPRHDRYQVIRELGEGGMGVVYEALDRERNTRVALKTMRSAELRAVVRFKAEFRALADILHPNLVALYELASDEAGSPFFTMELVEGVDLMRAVRQPGDDEQLEQTTASTQHRPPAHTATGRLTDVPRSRSVGEAVDLERLRSAMCQLAEAVAAIHGASLLHRDLKPSNVLVTDSGRVVVLDFGVVADTSDDDGILEHEGLVGSIPYMSPEQAACMPLTPASDWYSVGVILYQALTGFPPHRGASHDVLMNKQICDPPAPSQLVEGVPPDLDELCMALLARDPDDRPPTHEILRRFGSNAAQPATMTRTSVSAGGNLVGRESHLNVLREALTETRGGRAVAIHLRGRSGTGKSALVERFLDEARTGGAVVLAGRCYERESVAYEAVDSVIDNLCRHLTRLERDEVAALMPRDVLVLGRVFPTLRQVEAIAAATGDVGNDDPYELRRRAFAALRELLGNMARDAPLVIFIDDLQWGDADSAPLIEALMRPPDEPSLLLIASYRSESESSSSLLADLLARQWSAGVAVRSLTVQELTEEQALELATTLARDAGLPDDAAAEIAREAGGNPFFIHELVRFAASHAAAGTGEVARQGVDEVIAARAARLPPTARRVLESVVVAGQPVGAEVIQRAAEVPAKELHTLLKVLRTGALVRLSGSRTRYQVEPHHDRVAETIAARLSSDERKQHHHRLALAYQTDPHPDPEALARHFRAADKPGLAAKYARIAADRAAETLSFARAAALYSQALDLGDYEPAERGLLLTKLGDALKNAGLGAESATAYLDAAELVDAGHALELRRQAAAQQLYSGRLDEGTATLEKVLEACGFRLAPTPRKALLRVAWLRTRLRLRGIGFKLREEADVAPRELLRIDVCYAAASGLGLVDFVRAAEFQTRGLLLALAAGEPRRIARSLANEVIMTSCAGRKVERRMRRWTAVLEQLTENSPDPVLRPWFNVASTNFHYQLGQFEPAAAHAHQALHDLSLAPMFHWEKSAGEIFRLWALYYLGTWRELDQRLRVIVGEARERGDLYTRTNLRTGLFNMMWLARDDPDGAAEDLRDAMSHWPDREFHLQHFWSLLSWVQLELYKGDGDAAARHLDGQAARLRRSLLSRIVTVRVELQHMLARAALLQAGASDDDRKRHLADAHRAAKVLDSERSAWADAFAHLARAGIARARGADDSMFAALTAAETSAASCNMAMYVTAIRRRRGELLGGDEGRALVTAADEHMAAEGVTAPDKMAAALIPLPEPA